MREVISQFTDDEFEYLMKHYPNEHKELVRCGDCKYRHDLFACVLQSEGYQVYDDYYCASAERISK